MTKKRYMALFVKEIVATNEPIFLTFSLVVKITAKPIITPNGDGKFSLIDGEIKKEVNKKLKKLRAEDKLFWGIGARKVPRDAEIIVMPLQY